MLKFGKKNRNHFVCHHDNTTPPKTFHFSHSHLFGLNAPKIKPNQGVIDVCIEIIGNSVWTNEFNNQINGILDKHFYLDTSSTCPLIASKLNVNITVYNVDSALTNYFYRHDD